MFCIFVDIYLLVARFYHYSFLCFLYFVCGTFSPANVVDTRYQGLFVYGFFLWCSMLHFFMIG